MIEDACKRSTRWRCQIKLTFNSVLSRIKKVYILGESAKRINDQEFEYQNAICLIIRVPE